MEGCYAFHPERGYVELSITGVVTLAEIRAFLINTMNDSRWNPAYNGIADYTGARFEMVFGEVLDLSETLRDYPRATRGQWANVVATDVSFGMIRMFQALSEEFIHVRLFRDRRQAEAWLHSHPIPVCGTEI